MPRYRRDHSAEEAELEELEKQFRNDVDETTGKLKEEDGNEIDSEESVNKNKESNNEEDTYKKRYGDLRRHAQKKEEDLAKEIEALKSQLQSAVSNNIQLPDVSSKEEAEQWIEKYPDLAKVFRYLAVEQDTKLKAEVTKTREELDKIKYQEMRVKAYRDLLKLQPDAEKILGSEEFSDWLDTKSKFMQDSIRSRIDPNDASDTIDVYKAQVLSKKKTNKDDDKTKEDARGAAESTTRSTSGAPKDGKDEVVWSESYVDEMSRKNPRWYEKNEDKIDEMIAQGKFVFDMSGAAR